jgi:hypothetical protein
VSRLREAGSLHGSDAADDRQRGAVSTAEINRVTFPDVPLGGIKAV